MMDNETQLALEQMFHANQLMPRLRSEFDHPFYTSAAEAGELPVPFVLDLLAHMALRKRTTPEMMVGILAHHFKAWENPVQTCADALMVSVMLNLVDFDERDGQSGRFILRWDVTQEVQEEMARYQYPLPMVVPPQPLVTNRDCGYLTRTFPSVLLGDNHIDEDVCLDHINRVNQTRYTINVDTVRLIQNRWKALDKPKDGETMEDFAKRKKAFAKYDSSSREVIEHLVTLSNELWLTHRYDHRGRTYAQGYHCSTQGNAWSKAILEFADQEPLEGYVPQQQEIAA